MRGSGGRSGSLETADRTRGAPRRFVALAAAVLATGGAGAASMPAEAQGDAPVAPRFVDVARQSGLTAVQYGGGPDRDHILESTGSGAAFLDFDGDSRLDIYLVNGWALDEEPSNVRVRGRNVLYRGVDGGFEDVTERSGTGDDGWGCGVCVGDFDGDGRPDLYVTNFGPNRLYRNRGDGTFEEVASRAGVDDDGWGAGAAFFDADGDGDLDLYVANYIACTLEEVIAARRTNRWRDQAHVMAGPFGLKGGSDRFYSNAGDGTFRDATDEAGMTDLAEAYGLGVLASDLDADGDVDVYVANDSNPNYLYRNEGDGTFTEMGGWSGAGFNVDGAAQAGMGVDAADVDGDGLQDIFVTNFARDHCTLYRNEGDLFFKDVTVQHEIRAVTHMPLSWGCAFFDYDRDADADLFIVNGHIYPQVDEFTDIEESYRQAPLLFRNDGGRFVHSVGSTGTGLDLTITGRGLAVGDYDDDGDLDLLLTAIDEPPRLLRNDTPTDSHWLKLRLLNPRGGHAMNARAVISAGGVTQVAEVRSGSTYQSQNAMDLHFGLGEAAVVETIEIRWPDGTRAVERAVAADELVVIRQSGDE